MVLKVLLKLAVMLCVASWFAVIPAGTETMIAMEKLKAMITSNALIFLLEMFLTALVKAPKPFTIQTSSEFDPERCTLLNCFSELYQNLFQKAIHAWIKSQHLGLFFNAINNLIRKLSGEGFCLSQVVLHNFMVFR
jgi:hypothetical protein